MTYISIGTDCSGIESILYALKKLKIKYKHIFSCDNNKYAKESILANFKPITFYDNMLTRNIKKVPYVDLYVCGFPCQPFSTAGKKMGFNDNIKGNIFFNCYKYIKTKIPKIFILENVKGIINHDSGKTFDTISNMLNNLKMYKVYYFLMNTKDYGIPQNRERLFIIGINKNILKKELNFPTKIPLKKNVLSIIKKLNDEPSDSQYHLSNFEKKNLRKLRSTYKKKNINIDKIPIIADLGASYRFMSHMINISPTLKASRSNYYVTNLKRKFTPRETLALQGFPKSFKIVVSDNQMYKQAGNSISVNVLYYLLKEIFNSIKKPPKSFKNKK